MVLSNCLRCRLGSEEGNISNCISGRGAIPSDVVFIGEAPGRDEDKLSMPFVGAAGRQLGKLLERADIEESKTFITNVVRCRPPNNRDPKPDELEACRPYLLAELEKVKPKLLVLLGNSALKLLGKGYRTVTKERGETYKWNGFDVLITLHPADTLRKWEDEAIVVNDFRRIPRILKGEIRCEKTDYRVVRDLESLRLLAGRLLSADEFAFDIESEGFDWRHEKILCISFCDTSGTSFVVPLLGQNLTPIWEERQLPEVLLLLKTILESDVPKIAQNYKFDFKFLKQQLGIETKNIAYDTIQMHHILDENLPNNLDFLGSYYLNLPRHDKEVRAVVTSKGISFRVIPNEILWPYSAADPDVTLRLKEHFDPLISQRLFRRISMPLARALTEIEMCGVYIDQKKLQGNSEKFVELILEQEQRIYKEVGYEFKINSPKVLSQILFSKEGLGLPSAGKTTVGNDKTGKEELEGLAGRLRSEGCPEERLGILDAIIRYRNLRHWKTTFIDGFDGTAGLKRWIHEDGRIYPNYQAEGTGMGRLASREPNLQNVPRDEDLRNQFAAPEGWLLLEVDASQAEARAGAVQANCRGLLEAMEKGLDIHTTAAARLRHCSYEEVTEEQRDRIKFVTHGLHYGRSIPSIALEYGLPIREVTLFVEEYFLAYPELAELMLSTVDRVEKGEPVVNAFGRVRHFPATIGGHQRRAAISFMFASSWADTMSLNTWKVLERFEKEGVWKKDVKITMSLHDALFFEVREEALDRVVPMIIEELEAPIPEMKNYCFPVKIVAGRCWEDPKGLRLWKGS